MIVEVDLRSSVEQRSRYIQVTPESGCVQSGSSVVQPGIHLGVVFKKDPHDLQVTLVGRRPQWSSTVRVFSVNVGSVLYQRYHALPLAALRCRQKWVPRRVWAGAPL